MTKKKKKKRRRRNNKETNKRKEEGQTDNSVSGSIFEFKFLNFFLSAPTVASAAVDAASGPQLLLREVWQFVSIN